MTTIDIRSALTSRLKGWKRLLVPRPVTALLARIIRQDDLNRILRTAHPRQGSEFATDVLRQLDISIQVTGLDAIPENSRCIFASNHPLGGLDGITLIRILGQRYGDTRIRFVVNDMLMHVTPLAPVFLPVNKYGSQARGSALAIDTAFRSDAQIIIFPAGLVSRLGDRGTIADLAWQKSFILKAVQTQRDIVPVRFEARNRMRFYRFARWRRRLRIPFNLEQALLPAELCAARGSQFKITFLPPIPWQTIRSRLDNGETPRQIAASIRTLSQPLQL